MIAKTVTHRSAGIEKNQSSAAYSHVPIPAAFPTTMLFSFIYSLSILAANADGLIRFHTPFGNGFSAKKKARQ
ncbi:hypothetical protein [Oxalobacter formigenes]|uniref:hypothetical protein n=1 Tax=Oxalobacter formigenes TaxID=847 RepID=UPI0012FC828E|nr:hypothetical protein [Oxalobacter formigenes]